MASKAARVLAYSRKVSSEIETQQFAEEFVCALLPHILSVGVVLGLSGPIGSGKTAFMRFLSAALGSRVPVSSPSYVLCHEYPCRDGVMIEHWDLYRLRDAMPDELYAAPVPGMLRAIEWIERSTELVEAANCLLESAIESETARMFSVRSAISFPMLAA